MNPVSASNAVARNGKLSDDQVKPKSPDENESLSELEKVIGHDIYLALKGLQFGEITITVREGQVVQIERIARSRQLLSKRNG